MAALIPTLHFLFLAIFVVFVALPSSNGVDDRYKTCSSMFFACGNFTNVGYPFWGDGRPQYCGHPALQLQCLNSQTTDTLMLKVGTDDEAAYHVLSMNVSDLNISLTLGGFTETSCTSYSKQFSEIFQFSRSVEIIYLLYNCPKEKVETVDDPRHSLVCNAFQTKFTAYYLSNVTSLGQYASCTSMEVAVLRKELDQYNKGVGSLSDVVLQQGFEVNYEFSSACVECISSGGVCGSSFTSDFVCLCKDGDFPHVCRKSASSKTRRLIVVGSVSLAMGIGMLFVMGWCLRKKRSTRKFAVLWKSEATTSPNVDAFLRIYGSFSLTRYTYVNLKKMTDGFRDKLGEGGYAVVYRGKLSSGRLVAVKLLKQLKGDGKDFLNEVASISRTNHVNIVALLGFCFEGNKRALIYEFMPNGSLEKFTYHGASNQSLPWETLSSIAIGVARGLDYLHRGCNARILHFDIKPHNILLSEDFCPKISDFGMARLCSVQENTISMLEARGTIGYIAPEVFCRTIGGVSHKSDVYSFGMMVLDMVCGRKHVSADLQQSSEMFFPQWIYNRLNDQDESAFQGTTNEEDRALQRKMVLVSLWCIQTYPLNRPSISRVIDMLQGSLESIEMPPKPNLSPSPSSLALQISETFTQTSDLESSSTAQYVPKKM